MVGTKLGIDKTREVFADLEVLVVSGVKLTKSGIGIGSIGKIVDIGNAVNELIKDVPGALPELQDLDGDESAKLGEASYRLVKAILDAAAKK